jgi:UDP-2-acetamido-3-amino-2,3-dideoxy-glucuronate N-acetyltransferase
VVEPPGVRVHPLGLCESDDVGAGTRIWAWAHVLPDARVGVDCNVCDHAFIEGGARLGDRVTVKNGVLVFDGVEVGDDVFLGPGVVFTNDLRPRAHVKRGADALLPTVVEDGVTLGAGTVVVCGTRIGRHAFAAAGSVITRDVAPHSFVAGNPATPRGWVCTCGERLSEDLSCRCGRSYRLAADGLVRMASRAAESADPALEKVCP